MDYKTYYAEAIKRVIELEHELQSAREREHEKDLRITGLTAQLLTEMEETRCDRLRNFSGTTGR